MYDLHTQPNVSTAAYVWPLADLNDMNTFKFGCKSINASPHTIYRVYLAIILLCSQLSSFSLSDCNRVHEFNCYAAYSTVSESSSLSSMTLTVGSW